MGLSTFLTLPQRFRLFFAYGRGAVIDNPDARVGTHMLRLQGAAGAPARQAWLFLYQSIEVVSKSLGVLKRERCVAVASPTLEGWRLEHFPGGLHHGLDTSNCKRMVGF